jgi:hypothetical protein
VLTCNKKTTKLGKRDPKKIKSLCSRNFLKNASSKMKRSCSKMEKKIATDMDNSKFLLVRR